MIKILNVSPFLHRFLNKSYSSKFKKWWEVSMKNFMFHEKNVFQEKEIM